MYRTKALKKQTGDRLSGLNSETCTVEDIHIEFVKEIVYNFQVEDFHTYHVGTLGVLVHNSGCPKIDGDNVNAAGSESGKIPTQRATENGY